MVKKRTLNHQIWDIAWPAILSNISIPLLGLVDTALLGHLGDTQYLGAVAIGGALLAFLYWGFSFLRMGTTGLVAKSMGAGQEQQALLVLAQSGVLALFLAFVVIFLQPYWLQAGLSLMTSRDDLSTLAQSYAGIRIYSAPAVLLTYACVGWFIGRANTRWPMAIVVTTNVANVGLDFLFIVGLELNSDGAAIATVCAEYLGCALALYGVYRSVPNWPDSAFFRELRRWGAYRLLLRSNRHLFVRTTCLLFSFAFFTAMGERLGPDILAANAIMIQLLMLAAYSLDGFAYAAEALTGNRLGGRDLPGFYAVVRQCSYWCALSACAICLTFFIFQTSLFSLFTDLQPVLDTMHQHRWWLIALPLLAAPSYLLDGVFIGAVETRLMMLTMLISTIVIYLPSWFLTLDWGNHGLWFAFSLFNATRGVTLFACYHYLNKQGKWLT